MLSGSGTSRSRPPFGGAKTSVFLITYLGTSET